MTSFTTQLHTFEVIQSITANQITELIDLIVELAKLVGLINQLNKRMYVTLRCKMMISGNDVDFENGIDIFLVFKKLFEKMFWLEIETGMAINIKIIIKINGVTEIVANRLKKICSSTIDDKLLSKYRQPKCNKHYYNALSTPMF